MPQRRMYPYQQQTYLPMSVQYQPQYDPAFTQMMAQNMQQTQQRHDVVTAQMAEDMARRGEMFSYDPEYQKQVLGAYQEDLDKIAKDYGFNYAQAASKLVGRIGEEALNPFYNLNKYKVQEAERAAQLRAQFGPEAIVLRDPMSTPITSDSKVEDFRADIIKASDYQTIADRMGKDLKGSLRSLGLANHPDFAAFMQHGSIEQLTESQIRELATNPDVIAAFKANAPTTALDNREGFEWTQDDEGIANFLYGNWAQKAYSAQRMNYVQNPMWTATTRGRGNSSTRLPSFPGRAAPATMLEKGAKEIRDTFNRFRRDLTDRENSSVILEDLESGTDIVNRISQSSSTSVDKLLKTSYDKLSPEEQQMQQELLSYYSTVNPNLAEAYLEIDNNSGLLKVREGSQPGRNVGSPQMSRRSPDIPFSDLISRDLSNFRSNTENTRQRVKNLETREAEFKADYPFYTLMTENGISREDALSLMEEEAVNRTASHYFRFKIPSIAVVEEIATDVRSDPSDYGKAKFMTADGVKDGGRRDRLQSVLASGKVIGGEIIPATGELVITVAGENNKDVSVVVPASALYSGGKETLETAGNLLAEIRESRSPEGGAIIGDDVLLYEKYITEDGIGTDYFIQVDGYKLPISEEEFVLRINQNLFTSLGYKVDFKKEEYDPYGE